MKINDRNLTGTSASETGRTQETQKPGRAGAGKSSTLSIDGSNDSVVFSGTLSRLSRTLTTFESSRTNRVQALAAQYQSGNYKPNSAAISKGMVSEAMSAGLQ
jgi:anti-sigma28 factor (negative regulator of flagellin synthesis)